MEARIPPSPAWYRSRPARALMDLGVAALLYWLVQGQYRNATGMIQVCDSTYTVAVAEQFLATGSTNLIGMIPADRVARSKLPGYLIATDLPYHLTRGTDPAYPAVYYGYPLGMPILAMPFVAGYRTRGLSAFLPDGTPHLANEADVQHRIASKLTAVTVAAFYVLGRFFGSVAVSFLVALGFGLGSSASSTLARALWSHTGLVLLLTLALILLVACRRAGPLSRRTSLLAGAALGSLAFAMLVVRPHAMLSLAPIGVYLLAYERRLLPGTLLAGLLEVAAFAAVSRHAFGTFLPPSVYEADAIDGRDVFNRLFWLLLSPSRGLLVFMPYLLVVAGILAACRRRCEDAPLLLPAGLSFAVTCALFANYVGWHAGTSYGPRYFVDLLPWFVLATSLALAALARSPWGVKRLGASILLAACFAWGGFVHWRGANAFQAWEWNYRAIQVGEEAAVKDWAHPQFLAGLTYTVLPDGTFAAKPSAMAP